MPLAVSSYRTLPTLGDEEGLLNLAWTLDERELLSVDLAAVAARELADEVQSGLPFVNSYFVRDPYGEDLLGPAVRRFHAIEDGRAGIICAAGVNSLLHALAPLSHGAHAAIVGTTYPDFPHWVAMNGGTCVSQIDGAAVVLVERPSLTSGDTTLAELRELCNRVADSGAIVVVDESYANYERPEFSAVAMTEQVPNLAVLGGFSKAYWQGGLRLAYCVSSESATARVRSLIPPMLASSLSLRIGRAILELGDIAAPLRERVPAAKSEMLACLRAAGYTSMHASSAHVPYVFLDAGSVDVQRVEAAGILGKPQPFWSASETGVVVRYRLSVPLAPRRMEQFRRKIEGCR